MLATDGGGDSYFVADPAALRRLQNTVASLNSFLMDATHAPRGGAASSPHSPQRRLNRPASSTGMSNHTCNNGGAAVRAAWLAAASQASDAFGVRQLFSASEVHQIHLEGLLIADALAPCIGPVVTSAGNVTTTTAPTTYVSVCDCLARAAETAEGGGSDTAAAMSDMWTQLGTMLLTCAMNLRAQVSVHAYDASDLLAATSTTRRSGGGGGANTSSLLSRLRVDNVAVAVVMSRLGHTSMNAVDCFSKALSLRTPPSAADFPSLWLALGSAIVYHGSAGSALPPGISSSSSSITHLSPAIACFIKALECSAGKSGTAWLRLGRCLARRPGGGGGGGGGGGAGPPLVSVPFIALKHAWGLVQPAGAAGGLMMSAGTSAPMSELDCLVTAAAVTLASSTSSSGGGRHHGAVEEEQEGVEVCDEWGGPFGPLGIALLLQSPAFVSHTRASRSLIANIQQQSSNANTSTTPSLVPPASTALSKTLLKVSGSGMTTKPNGGGGSGSSSTGGIACVIAPPSSSPSSGLGAVASAASPLTALRAFQLALNDDVADVTSWCGLALAMVVSVSPDQRGGGGAFHGPSSSPSSYLYEDVTIRGHTYRHPLTCAIHAVELATASAQASSSSRQTVVQQSNGNSTTSYTNTAGLVVSCRGLPVWLVLAMVLVETAGPPSSSNGNSRHNLSATVHGCSFSFIDILALAVRQAQHEQHRATILHLANAGGGSTNTTAECAAAIAALIAAGSWCALGVALLRADSSSSNMSAQAARGGGVARPGSALGGQYNTLAMRPDVRVPPCFGAPREAFDAARCIARGLDVYYAAVMSGLLIDGGGGSGSGTIAALLHTPTGVSSSAVVSLPVIVTELDGLSLVFPLLSAFIGAGGGPTVQVGDATSTFCGRIGAAWHVLADTLSGAAPPQSSSPGVVHVRGVAIDAPTARRFAASNGTGFMQLYQQKQQQQHGGGTTSRGGPTGAHITGIGGRPTPPALTTTYGRDYCDDAVAVPDFREGSHLSPLQRRAQVVERENIHGDYSMIQSSYGAAFNQPTSATSGPAGVTAVPPRGWQDHGPFGGERSSALRRPSSQSSSSLLQLQQGYPPSPPSRGGRQPSTSFASPGGERGEFRQQGLSPTRHATAGSSSPLEGGATGSATNGSEGTSPNANAGQHHTHQTQQRAQSPSCVRVNPMSHAGQRPW